MLLKVILDIFFSWEGDQEVKGMEREGAKEIKKRIAEVCNVQAQAFREDCNCDAHRY